MRQIVVLELVDLLQVELAVGSPFPLGGRSCIVSYLQ